VRTLSLDRWQLQVQAPAPGAAYPNQAPWDARLLQRAQAAQLTPSPELRCAAGEAARFYAENGAFPDTALNAYVLARCGSTLAQASSRTLAFELEDSEPDSELLAAASQRLDALLAAASGTLDTLVGLGFARAHGRASFVLYRGERRVALEEFSPLVDAGAKQFSIRGRLLGDTTGALALVTQGPYGITSCTRDRGLLPPQFGFRCPMQARDEQAVVEVVTRSPQRLLTTPMLRGMVRRSPDAALTYRPEFSLLRPARGAEKPADASFAGSLLAALNRLRSKAKLAPLALAPKQSELNARMAARFFAAAYAEDQEMSDQLALGVLAGWDVGGVIRGAGVCAHGENSNDGARWLGLALQDPLARFTLLDPEASRIAIGTASPERAQNLALVSTYTLLDSAEHSRDEADLFEELGQQREARGLPPPLRRAKGKELTRALEQIADGELTSAEALESALSRISKSTGLHMQGVFVETSDLALLPVPDKLLAGDSLELELGVTHYQLRGSAWAQYTVLYLLAASTAAPGYHPSLPAVCGRPVLLDGAVPAPSDTVIASYPGLSMRAGHALLAINPTLKPYRPAIPDECVPRGEVQTSIVQICVSPEGYVSGVKILQESLPIIDSQLPTVMGRWRYHPYLEDGKPTAFCYQITYHVR
jgi:hypothetical protein